MRLRSIGRKVSYVLMGALGCYVVERLPEHAKDPPARTVFIEDQSPRREPGNARPQRPAVDTRKLYAAFAGSRPEPKVRCTTAGFDVLELGPDYRAVHHSFVDAMLEEQSQLMRTTRLIPVMQSGHTTGVKIFGVRQGDALWKLGFRNGDELRDVNEMDISDPTHALEAYGRIRDDQDISAGIVRDGQPMRLRFVIC